MRILIFLLAVCFSCSFPADMAAQVFRRRHALPNELPPKAILIQLSTGYTRLNRAGREEFKEQLKKDMKISNERMILDFQENFTFCPVYYFNDSDIRYIINHEFFGYLRDAKRQLIRDHVMQEGDTNFFILHFGYMLNEDENDLDLPLSQRMLIASDHKGEMLRYPLPATTYFTDTRKLKNKRYKSEYRYNSHHTDVEYRPRALQYSALLKNFYSKPQQTSNE
jgi:hypothetical protein